MKQTDEKGNPLTYWGGLEEPKQETFKVTVLDYGWNRVWRLAIHSRDLDFSDNNNNLEAIEQFLIENGFTKDDHWIITEDLEIYTNKDL